jgi:hypothetical protein
MRYLTVLFASLVLASCSAGPVSRSESHPASPTKAPDPEQQKVSIDSVVQFLLESAATDFRAHGPSPAGFRDVHIGHDMNTNGESQYILCGQFLRSQDGRKDEWMPFATIKTSGYEQYVGTRAVMFCQGASFLWDTEVDFSSTLQTRFDSLRGEPH